MLSLFDKIKNVIVELDELLRQIQADQVSRITVEEPIGINIFAICDNPDQSTTELNGHFVHSLLLIDVLIRMKSIESDKQQLISLCQREYENNPTQLDLLHEFETEYSADKALWWYTRESFLYKMLNKALRVQNVEVLFLFRFVIADIYQQLKEKQCQSPVRVYRGQVMCDEEFSQLRQSIGELISINSFFSTSADRQKAVRFSNRSYISDGLHRILFEIDADPNVVTSKPFASICGLSRYGNECEVLFMIGSVFRLKEILREEDNQIWVIRMELCGDAEHELKQLFDHMKKSYGCGDKEINHRSLGDVLRNMGKYDLAEKMYHRLLNELSPTNPALAGLYKSLGLVAKEKGELDCSLQWLNASLEIKMRTDPHNHIYIGNLYNWIGVIYERKGDNDTALDYYKNSIRLFQEAGDENHPSMAHFYNNSAIIYRKQEKYMDALDFYKKALSIHQEHLPLDHPDVASAHNNIGVVYHHLGQYEAAMEHLHESLNIRLRSLSPQHPQLADSYRNIGLVCEANGEVNDALVCYQKAIAIYHHSLASEHPDVIQTETDIQRLSSEST